ncbi:hypothetical protein BH11ACT6_BH11ACT6_00160 [soil metagenome]
MSDPTESAKAPLAPPAATGTAIVLAAGLIALGVVAGREALLDSGLINGTPWITTALDAADGATAPPWLLPAGVVVAVVGVLLVWAAIKPRKRTHRPLRVADTWISRGDVARVARVAAERNTGVSSVSTSGAGRSLTLTVVPLAGFDTEEVEQSVKAEVTQALSSLTTPPRLKLRIKRENTP